MQNGPALDYKPRRSSVDCDTLRFGTQLYVKTLLLAAINDNFGYEHDDDHVGLFTTVSTLVLAGSHAVGRTGSIAGGRS